MNTLIIDDRIERQKKLCKNSQLDLSIFSDSLHLVSIDQYNNFENNFRLKEFSQIEKYNVLIIHKSAFEASVLTNIENYCNSTKKKLVYFTGNLSAPKLNNINAPAALITPEILYSNKLTTFLQFGGTSLDVGYLVYGKNYKLNILLNNRARIWKIYNFPPEDSNYQRRLEKAGIDVTSLLSSVGISVPKKKIEREDLKKALSSLSAQISNLITFGD